MKKIIVMNIINNEETFINEVVNMMPAICEAKFDFIDMENCILVNENEKAVDAAKTFLKNNKVRFVIE